MSKYVSKNSKVLIEFFSDMTIISYNYRIPNESKFIENPIILNLIESLPISDFKVGHIKLSNYYGNGFLRLKIYPSRKELEIWSDLEISSEKAVELIKNSR